MTDHAPDLTPHTCDHPPQVDTCAGCRQRDELHLQPISQAVRDRLRARELIERGPVFSPIWVDSTWLAACGWCGALVVSEASRVHPTVAASKDAHKRWHVRLADALRLAGVPGVDLVG